MRRMFFCLIGLALLLPGCGGGGDGDSGPVTTQSLFVGQQTTSSSYGDFKYSDLTIAGDKIKDLYIAGNGGSFDVDLKKIPEFQGQAYQSSDGTMGFYFDSTGQYMAALLDAKAYAVYQDETLPVLECPADSINGDWAGSVFFRSDRDGKLYQSEVSATCTGRICSFGNGEVVIDFARQFYSDFWPEGKWYGREINNGPRSLTSALISGDLQFMAMPMCWNSIPLSGEDFFDLCQIAILSRESQPPSQP